MQSKAMLEALRAVLQPMERDGVITHVYAPTICICEDEDIRDLACEAHKPPPAPYTFIEEV